LRRFAVSQTRLFEWKREAPTREPAVARVLIAGVHAELLHERVLPDRVIRVDRNLGIRYVSEAELNAAGLEPAFWLAPIVPGAPNRRVLFETLANEVVEQDERSGLWIDDQPLLPAALASFGSAESRRELVLEIGECAALLLIESQPGGWDLRVRITTPILWIHDLPRPARAGPVLDGWLAMAAEALQRVEAAT
jgi:hypothetical protein